MIVVKIELHSAITHKITTLGQMVIANIGGSAKRGDYNVVVVNKRSADKHPRNWMHNDVARKGQVENYPRLSYNVWRLVLRALKSSFPEEK